MGAEIGKLTLFFPPDSYEVYFLLFMVTEQKELGPVNATDFMYFGKPPVFLSTASVSPGGWGRVLAPQHPFAVTSIAMVSFTPTWKSGNSCRFNMMKKTCGCHTLG